MLSVLELPAAKPSPAERERRIAAVLAWSQVGGSRRSDEARQRAAVRFEGYLRSRPADVLDDLYRSLPAAFRGGARG